MNTVITYKIKGFIYTAGMVEPDEEPGFYNWSMYLFDTGGLATSRREARAFIKEEFFKSIKDGSYQREYERMEENRRVTA